MDLKKLLGEAYKDGMTIDEMNAALKGKDFVDVATLPKSVNKEVFDKTASELAKANKELKKLQEDSMTADEKLKLELDKASLAQQNYTKELSKLRAKEIFVGAGLKQEDYESILESVVSEDEEITKTRATNMVKLIASQKEAVEKSVKAELLKSTPHTPAGDGGGAEGAFEKQLATARETGDMAAVAAIIRQQATAQQTTK